MSAVAGGGDHAPDERSGAVIAHDVFATAHVEPVDTGHSQRLDGVRVRLVDDATRTAPTAIRIRTSPPCWSPLPD